MAIVSLGTVALFSMMFLFSVSFTNASFQGTEVPVPRTWNVAEVVAPQLNDTLAVVGQTLGWSVATAADQVGQPVLNFFGVVSSSQSSPQAG